uniref:Uncharacterized protein n=1 Tax=Angiostrongylus cantonensis TaxID=6313 RepID=A0A0K0CTK7_ANGCA
MVSALLKVAIVEGEWPKLSHEMSELSAQAARPRPSRATTSPLPFAEQIGPPSLRAKRAITPIPTVCIRMPFVLLEQQSLPGGAALFEREEKKPQFLYEVFIFAHIQHE